MTTNIANKYASILRNGEPVGVEKVVGKNFPDEFDILGLNDDGFASNVGNFKFKAFGIYLLKLIFDAIPVIL
jgi:hypothetical protein